VPAPAKRRHNNPETAQKTSLRLAVGYAKGPGDQPEKWTGAIFSPAPFSRQRHFLGGTHFHVQEFGLRSSERHPRGLAQINIAIDVLTVDISRPAETELDLLDQQQCAAYHPPIVLPGVQGRESYRD
jgi:hypothetical protein